MEIVDGGQWQIIVADQELARNSLIDIRIRKLFESSISGYFLTFFGDIAAFLFFRIENFRLIGSFS